MTAAEECVARGSLAYATTEVREIGEVASQVETLENLVETVDNQVSYLVGHIGSVLSPTDPVCDADGAKLLERDVSVMAGRLRHVNNRLRHINDYLQAIQRRVEL